MSLNKQKALSFNGKLNQNYLMYRNYINFVPPELCRFNHYLPKALMGRIMPMLTSVGLTGATIGQQIFRLVVYAFGVSKSSWYLFYVIVVILFSQYHPMDGQ
jgi:hypothetical protein